MKKENKEKKVDFYQSLFHVLHHITNLQFGIRRDG